MQGPKWEVGNATALWHLIYKINSPDGGFSQKFHMAEATESAVKVAAVDLAGRIKAMLPRDCNVFYATISRDNIDRDSRFIEAALGDGTYALDAPSVADSIYDYKRTALLLRFENEIGGMMSHKVCPVTDALIEEGELLLPPVAVVGKPVAAPAAPVEFEAFATTLNAFMQAVCFYCHHVVAGHDPGEAYTYYNILNSYFIGVTSKKGGRVFSR